MDSPSVREQLDRILRSRTFASKGQLRKLLEILSAHIDSENTLKPEHVIKELWPDETRTKRAADVATEMNRLRHALESYYREEGADDPIVIVLPNRSLAKADGRPEARWILARPRQENPPRTVHRNVWGLILKIAAAVAAIGATAYVAVRVFTVHDRPQFGRLDGSTLTIMNAEGKELWRKAFPEGFSADPYYYAQGVTRRIWFGDLDGTGHTSVLFLYLPGRTEAGSRSTVLICYSDRGEEKWRWNPGRDLPELHGSPATYWTVALQVLAPANGKPARIVTSSWQQPWWPNQIALIDSQGKTISEYWHSGHLEFLTLADLDRDGREEIIATGISNGYRQATMIVLDPDRVFGASSEPARPELQIHGMGAAQERLRLLFPRSDMSKALSPYNDALEPVVQHGFLRLSVSECLASPSKCLIWYEFDENFHLTTAYADDMFRSAHAEFYHEGNDAHPFTAEEQAEFQKVRCLAGCSSEFIPTNNR